MGSGDDVGEEGGCLAPGMVRKRWCSRRLDRASLYFGRADQAEGVDEYLDGPGGLIRGVDGGEKEPAPARRADAAFQQSGKDQFAAVMPARCSGSGYRRGRVVAFYVDEPCALAGPAVHRMWKHGGVY